MIGFIDFFQIIAHRELTRTKSATAGGVARGCNFIVHNSSFTQANVKRWTVLKRIQLPHSSRMSLDGSTASARRAGMADAAMPSSVIVSTAPPMTTGSRGFA
jgi:hypothetical protein